MLDVDRLYSYLRVFCDPQYAGFAGFPASQAAARQAWADAFFAYFDQVAEDVPAPPPGHPSLITASATTAWRGAHVLDVGMSPAAAAADFAGAWQAAIQSVSFAAVTDSGGNVWTASAFANVSTGHAALQTQLTGLFSAPASDAPARLSAIADAFDAATRSLIVTVSVVNSSSVPLPTVTMAIH